MSSDVIAQVHAFFHKAFELAAKGKILSAAENFGRGAEAARALGADNIVAARLQLRQGNLLLSAAADVKMAAHIRVANRVECIALFADAVAVMERRRVAGTLLEGKCSAVEQLYATQVLQEDKELTYAEAFSLARLFGYEVFVSAACSAMQVLANAGSFSAECSHTQLQFFAQHVVYAAELMQLPRCDNGTAVRVEGRFKNNLDHLVACEGVRGLDMRIVRLLAGAQQRLQRSGVLQARNVDQFNEAIKTQELAFTAAVQKSLNAPGLRSCALPGCGAREAHPAHFTSCAACRTVVYCCHEHQVAGWPGHKKACKEARKAAAEDEAGPSGA